MSNLDPITESMTNTTPESSQIVGNPNGVVIMQAIFPPDSENRADLRSAIIKGFCDLFSVSSDRLADLAMHMKTDLTYKYPLPADLSRGSDVFPTMKDDIKPAIEEYVRSKNSLATTPFEDYDLEPLSEGKGKGFYCVDEKTDKVFCYPSFGIRHRQTKVLLCVKNSFDEPCYLTLMCAIRPEEIL